MIHLQLVAVLVVSCSFGLAIATNQHRNDHVSWVIQLSDLHINKYVHHDIVPDLVHFGTHVVTKVKPGAILITGDLVDAKTKPEGSAQNEEEWQAYEGVWRHLAAAADLKPDAILDLRGNHDAFNTLRNTGQDLFAVYAATAAAHGQAAAAGQRVWSYELQPQLMLPTHQVQHQRRHTGTSSSSSRDQHNRRQLASQEKTAGEVGDSSSSSASSNSTESHQSAGLNQELLQYKRQQQQQHHQSRRLTSSGVSAGSCPAAVLVGVDFTPNVGLHAPANFFGVATVELIQQIKQQLQRIRGTGSSSSSSHELEPSGAPKRALAAAAAAASCGSVPIISYSHYPFSTVAASYAASSSMRQQRREGREGGGAVRDVLLRYDVTAHLSGHLHDLVGARLHVMYHKQQQQQQQQSDVSAGAYLADLESADWKQARRWRLVVVDSGVMSFADFRYKKKVVSNRAVTQQAAAAGGVQQQENQAGSGNAMCSGLSCSALPTGSSSSSSSRQGDYVIHSVDSSRQIDDHVIVITWPPDGRYSPLTAAAGAQQQQQWGWQQQEFGEETSSLLVLPVRALVIPLSSIENTNSSSSSSSSTSSLDVRVQYSCHGLSPGQTSSSSSSSHQQQMHPIGRPAASDSSSDQASSSIKGPQVFGTRLRFVVDELKQQCGGSSSSSSSVTLHLQVVASSTSGHVSTSDLRPVLLTLSTGLQHQQQQQDDDGATAAAAAAGGGVNILPLGNSILERTIMWFNGPSFGYWLFYSGWLSQVVGLLMIPRLFGRLIMRGNAALWRQAAPAAPWEDNSSSSSSSHHHQHQQQVNKGVRALVRQISTDATNNTSTSSSSRGSRGCRMLVILLLRTVSAAVSLVIRLSSSLVHQLLRLLLFPFASMCVLCCHHVGVWWVLLAHAVVVQWGPWFAAQMSSSSGGLGLWFRYGLLLPLPAELTPGWVGGDPLMTLAAAAAAAAATGVEEVAAAGSSDQHYVWLPLPDTYLVSSLFMCLVLAPVTLWMGLVVSAWHGAAAARHVSSSGGGLGAAAAGDVELVAAAAAVVDDEKLEISTHEGSCHSMVGSVGGSSSDMRQQQPHLLVNGDYSTGSSSSSRPQRTLSRTRSNTQAKHRESLDLPVSAAAAAGSSAGCGDGSSVSSSGISGGAAASDERASLLPAAAVTPTAAAAAMLNGVSSPGSSWLINLMPLNMMPAPAAVPSPTKKSRAAAAASGSSRAVHCRLFSLIPTLLWYLLGLFVLLVQVLTRLSQSLLVASRLPAHLLLLLLPIVLLWYKCCWRLGAAYGPVSLVLSPVVGWLPVLVVCCLRGVRRQIDADKAHRQE